MDFRDYLAELFDGAQAAGEAAVGDEADGFGAPFVFRVVEGGFQGRRVAVVVLGCDGDEGVGGGQALAIGLDLGGKGEVRGQRGGDEIDDAGVEFGVARTVRRNQSATTGANRSGRVLATMTSSRSGVSTARA